jgi:Ribbon-helix-helix protein, copG family
MSSLALTNVYLESEQKKALARKAKSNGTNLSVEVRQAVDAYLAGVSVDELKLLDAATKQAKTDIDAMNAILDGAQKRADRFFRDIAAVKKHEAGAKA